MDRPIIIIGAGLAGYQLARDFRKIDQTAPLTLITADEGQYYPKPQLSIALTQGKTPEALITANAETMAKQLKATVINQSIVSSINTATKAVFINDTPFYYHKLILAVGAEVIKPPLAGNGAADVVSINHIYHYATFQNLIKHKKTIAILGAGLIGCEFANDLSNAGYKVHVISPATAPLDLLVPAQIGQILQRALEDNGVHFHLQCVADRINKTEKGHSIELSNGNEMEVEFILSAVGLRPHIDLAKKAGIKIDRGICVNRFLETNARDVYALGDCAEVEGHVLPYIAPILNCSRALAKTLTGERTAVDYPAMPVVVKTPAHPIAVCPPPKNMTGHWEITTEQNNTRALFYNVRKQLSGFVLTNEAVKERAALAKQLPGLWGETHNEI